MEAIKKFVKENWKFLLLVLVGGLIGGYCLGPYVWDSLQEEALEQAISQGLTKESASLSCMIQYGIIYGFILAVIGIIFSKKVGLWKKFELDKKAITTTSIITIIGGLTLFPGDRLIFAPFNEWVMSTYQEAPSIYKVIGGLLVGGIVEEVMLRLFLMSLLSFIVYKLFYKKEKECPTNVFIIVNIVCAIFFAAGHLPGIMSMTTLTPILVFRCFLLNGGYGLAFGYLYRKHGIGYAMISHGLCHLIADTLMIIFL